MRIDEETENPFCRDQESQKWFTFEAQRKKSIAARKRRREIQTRIGKIKLYEELGRLIWNAYPNGHIFDIATGELVHFPERPGLFIEIACNQAIRFSEEYVERRGENQNN